MEVVYLLGLTEVGRLEEVLRAVRRIPGVTLAEAVTGPFDLIVRVEAPQINAALDTVVHRIRRVPGLRSTETLVTVTPA